MSLAWPITDRAQTRSRRPARHTVKLPTYVSKARNALAVQTFSHVRYD
jgi:hypothetical protein